MANSFESKVEVLLRRHNFEVLHSGWPDFMAFREHPPRDENGRITRTRGGCLAVEVKDLGDVVRPNQEQMHRILRRAGVPVWVVTPSEMAKIKKRERRLGCFLTPTDVQTAKDEFRDLSRRLDTLERSFNAGPNELWNQLGLQIETIKARLSIFENSIRVSDSMFEVIEPDDVSA